MKEQINHLKSKSKECNNILQVPASAIEKTIEAA
jgi:hypothetical protein